MRAGQLHLWLCWLVLFSTWSYSTADDSQVDDAFDNDDIPLTVGGFVDTLFCFEALEDADEDSDGRITDEEYVTFAQTMSPPGLISGVVDFAGLPLAYKVSFTATACLCNNPSFGGDDTAVDCCLGDNAHVRIPESPLGDPSSSDQSYLYATCSAVLAAAEFVMGSPMPTSSPHPSVEPTDMPTALPTAEPTTSPTLFPTTASPTMAPTGEPTPSPTLFPTAASPTMAPTGEPTGKPTVTPSTAAPTDSPTVEPLEPTAEPTTASPTTPAPTVFPTIASPTMAPGSPTRAPTGEPTGVPTPSPTVFPTIASPTITPGSPTMAPTGEPTEEPTGTPSRAAPTDSPTVEPTGPTRPPTPIVEIEVAKVEYVIGVTNGTLLALDDPTSTFVTDYLQDLLSAMNRLAPEVAINSVVRRELTRSQAGRRLAVTVELPTLIDGVRNVVCLEGLTASEDYCQTITAAVRLILTEEDNQDELVATFEADLFQSIFSGDLQEQLDEVNPDSPAFILTGLSVPDEPEGDNLSAGATAGIVLAAFFGLLLTVAILFATRDRHHDESKGEYEEFEAEQGASDVRSAAYSDAAVASTGAAVVGAAALGAASDDKDLDEAEYARRKELEAMEAGEDLVAEPGMEVAPDGSSYAGDSGWSSGGADSSLQTGSAEESFDAEVAARATLAAVSESTNMDSAFGTTSALGDGGFTRDMEAEPFEPPPPSKEQLDMLIEAGDWAAVGATAALLAAGSESNSEASQSQGETAHTGTSRSRESGSVDAARAAELDHLVASGDWEGVVLAAAKFQSSESASDNRTGSSLDSTDSKTGGSAGSGTGSGTGGSPSISTTPSETPSKTQKRAEVREEVEALVRRVVPEEIDNVDEMMNQFKGREEELVETLRTMQERAVAQKARVSANKAAKVQARQSVKRGSVPGVGISKRVTALEGSSPKRRAKEPSTPAAAAPVGVAVIPPDESRSALEMAIDAGDWEAVSEAAAVMSDTGASSVGTPGSSGDGEASQGSASRRELEGVHGNRAAEVDALIEVGDWSGVYAAAKRFTETDKTGREEGDVARRPADNTTSRASKEEEEALRQAEIWMRIADQKRTEGATDSGASEAAEWAIQRSLAQITEAEKKLSGDRRDEFDNDQEEDEV